MASEIAEPSVAGLRQDQPARRSWLLSRPALGAVATLVGRGAALAFTFALLAQFATTSDASSGLALLSIAGIGLVAAFARRGNVLGLSILYVLAFITFMNLRPFADETGIAVHYTLPIVADRLAFLGAIPSAWLQEKLYVPGRITPLEIFLGTVYITYFAAPHLAAILVWRFKPALFSKVAVAIALTFLVGLLLYFLVPTAPPWMASDEGRIPPVTRVMPELVGVFTAEGYAASSDKIGTNDVAAMPSLHTALTVIVALAMAQFGRLGRWLGGLYVFLMGLALVYLGEHYVIDEVAGVALAVGVWRITPSRLRLPSFLSGEAAARDDVGDDRPDARYEAPKRAA